MSNYKKGDVVNGATLLEPTTIQASGRNIRGWICRIHGDKIKILKERDLRRRKGTRTPPLQASLNRIYLSYKNRCRKRNLFFDLAIAEFHEIAQRVCSYCGKPPANGGRGIYRYNGIDRKDNRKGYTPANSIPCCAQCNAIKSNLLSFDEMRVAMEAVMKLRRGAG